eukprot:NODE_1134_length_1058_cov_243.406343_g780_i0.p1 GENE.NODE_1134_length_1058_cov_243.406343_g780_i0~~NODE_1134_length_1058_cov_243.406343_g780_i0.p1  ORF type:complete len:320 (-),score=92.10 NODE_1134_length_1058_cov_243.406343_g780_i0:98-1027(-)
MGLPFWAVYPFFFLPLLVLVLYSWRYHSNVTDLAHLLLCFLLGGTAVLLATFLVQWALDAIIVSVAHAAARRVHDYGSWRRLYLYVLVTQALAYPLPEGIATYVGAVTLRRGILHPKSFVVNSLYTAAGYTTGQSMALMCLVTSFVVAQSSGIRHPIPMAFAWHQLLAVSIGFLAFGYPLHMLTAYAVGLQVARHDQLETRTTRTRAVTFCRCQLISYVARAFYYCTFAVFVLYYHFRIPYLFGFPVCALITCAVLIYISKFTERQMPASYLARAGYLHLFGYGVLPQLDEAATDTEVDAHARPAEEMV